MSIHRAGQHDVARRTPVLRIGLDHLEVRSLLSTIPNSVVHVPVRGSANVIDVAPVHLGTASPDGASTAADSSGADASYFLALGIPAGVRNWVAKYPQKHIAEQFGSEVTRIRPIHISLVRDIAGISDLNNFENEVEGVVMGFEKVHGTINKTFEFKPTTGKVVPQKEPRFYVYNLSAVGATSGDFTALSQRLAALAPKAVPESVVKVHMSVFYNWSVEPTEIANELHKCCHEPLRAFHADDVMLVKSLGRHEYKVIDSWG